MRDLTRLKPAKGAADGELPPIWGLRQSIVFLGLLVLVAAVSFGSYLYFMRPKPQTVQEARQVVSRWSLDDCFMAWGAFQKFGVSMQTPDEAYAAKNAATLRNWIYVAGAFGLIGCAIMAAGWFWPTRELAPRGAGDRASPPRRRANKKK
jgi:hypothetical protein